MDYQKIKVYTGVLLLACLTKSCDESPLVPKLPDPDEIDSEVSIFLQSFYLHGLDEDGEKLWKYDGNSAAVYDIAVSHEGLVYSTSGGHRHGEVHKLIPEGDKIWSYDRHSDSVEGVSVDHEGYIYSASADGELHKISPKGEQIWVYDDLEILVRDVAVDPEGYVYSGTNHSDAYFALHKVSPEGEREWKYRGHDSIIESIVVDAEGYIYSGSYNELHKLNPDGEVEWVYSGQEAFVYDIAVDTQGNIYSLSEVNLHKLSPAGEKIWEMGEFIGGDGVAVDIYDNFYLSGYRGRFTKFSPDKEIKWHLDEDEPGRSGITVIPKPIWIQSGWVDPQFKP